MGKMIAEALALHRPANGFPVAVRVRPAGPPDRREILARTVRLQVIPQLLQRASHPGAQAHRGLAAFVEPLAALSRRAGGQEVAAFTAGLLTEGFSAEAILLDLLTPAAQLLGQQWADDVCSFTDVTVGVGHLRTAMHALRPAFLAGAPLLQPGAPRALLLPLPGEQHNFGAAMLCAFFIRAGWEVWDESSCRADLLTAVREDWIDLVGLSVAGDPAVDALRGQVAALRAASRNAGLAVMVGGPAFSRDPSLADVVGADGTALDGVSAVEVGAALLPAHRAPP